MKKTKKRRFADYRSNAHILGDKTFAAITSVEGLSLNPASRKRLADMKKRKLSNDEQRTAVKRAYVKSKIR